MKHLGNLVNGNIQIVHFFNESHKLDIEKIGTTGFPHLFRRIQRQKISNSSLGVNDFGILKLIEGTEHSAGIDRKLYGHLTHGGEFCTRRPFAVDYP